MIIYCPFRDGILYSVYIFLNGPCFAVFSRFFFCNLHTSETFFTLQEQKCKQLTVVFAQFSDTYYPVGHRSVVSFSSYLKKKYPIPKSLISFTHDLFKKNDVGNTGPRLNHFVVIWFISLVKIC